jgi:hypothetical protein
VDVDEQCRPAHAPVFRSRLEPAGGGALGSPRSMTIGWAFGSGPYIVPSGAVRPGNFTRKSRASATGRSVRGVVEHVWSGGANRRVPPVEKPAVVTVSRYGCPPDRHDHVSARNPGRKGPAHWSVSCVHHMGTRLRARCAASVHAHRRPSEQDGRPGSAFSPGASPALGPSAASASRGRPPLARLNEKHSRVRRTAGERVAVVVAPAAVGGEAVAA